MKKFLSFVISTILIITFNLFLSRLFNVSFVEMSFPAGLLSFIFVGFFSSEGGLSTSISNLSVKRFMDSNDRKNNDDFKLHINVPFLVSLIYTIISTVASIIVYWQYF